MTSSLARRLILSNGALIGAMLVMGGAALAGLLRVEQRLAEATEEYEELRLAEQATQHAAIARTLLDATAATPIAAAAELRAAVEALEQFRSYQASEDDELDRGHQRREGTVAEAAATALAGALAAWERGGPDAAATAGDRAAEALDALEQLVAATSLDRIRGESTAETRLTITAVTAVAAAVVVGTLVVSIVAYRMIMRPVRSFGAAAQSIAQGRFDERIAPPAVRELRSVADDFNRMAADLDVLYRNMEAQVERHSRELVRSERLASVGFLAAGLAHEINNPLGIITGYAELAGGWLEDEPSPTQLAETREALDTIRNESFRCKRIVDQLLSLSRGGGGDGARQRVSLRRLAEDTASMVRGLQRFRDRKVEVRRGDGDPFVIANEPELRQVLLNLVVNGLEAVASGGQVVIETAASGGEAVVRVRDDGRGLAEAELQRVFEPFFTARQTAGIERGVGLGLTISHAIAERHGGRLTAESDGPGRGSCFTLALPRAPRTETRA